MTEYTVKAFKDYLKNEELMGVECRSCGHLMLPPRPVCNRCGSTDLGWKKYGGAGAIAASTLIAVPLSRFQERCPHGVGVVTLDEGVSISGFMLDERIEVGQRVEAAYLREGEDVVLAFKSV
ncbi:OB-fold domain-containing protein [Candidatus Bathyarchaeota archaeon]|nr:OB-fold domain-containing protein [Candidatus Bathyarchaeota archaeon]